VPICSSVKRESRANRERWAGAVSRDRSRNIHCPVRMGRSDQGTICKSEDLPGHDKKYKVRETLPRGSVSWICVHDTDFFVPDQNNRQENK